MSKEVEKIHSFLKEHYWLGFGALGYIAGLVWASLWFIEWNYEGGNFLFFFFAMIGTPTVYFLYLASIGSLFKPEERKTMRWMCLFTLFFVLATFVTILIYERNILFALFFTVAYPVFFLAFGIDAITRFLKLPEFVSGFFALIYNLLFILWISLEHTTQKMKATPKLTILKRVLLIIIFLVLSIGMVSCVQSLTNVNVQ